MSAKQTTSEAIEQRLDELAAQLGIVQTMTATAVAIMVRMAGEDYAPRILDELRRNILLTLASTNPNANQDMVLTHEEGTDRLLDEIVRLSRNVWAGARLDD